MKTLSGNTIISETLVCDALVIAEDAVLSAPDGKQLTLSENGVCIPLAPGTYRGQVVLSVTEDIPFQFYCFDTPHHYRTAVCIQDGKHIPEKSVSAVIGPAQVAPGVLRNANIRIKEPAFNGVYVDGSGDFLMTNCFLDLEGNGGNDFAGYGAAVMTNGTVNLTIDHSTICTKGAARGAIFSGDRSNIFVKNSTISVKNGTLPQEYRDTIALGKMMAVPWMLGLRGNCRATNLVDYATAHYENCHLSAEGWGVLSTDIVDSLRLYAKDCLIEITGESGYGSYSISDSYNTFDHCVFRCPDYALIVANKKAGGRFTGGTVVETNRNAVMSFQNTGGILTVEDGCVLRSKETTFMLKGSCLQLEVDRSQLLPGNGVLLQLIDCDDPGNPGAWYTDPQGPDTPNPQRDLWEALPGRDPIVRFSNMSLKGDIFNASSNLLMDRTGFPQMEMPTSGMPQNSPNASIPQAPKGDQAMNLGLILRHVELEGRISAATAHHFAERIDKSNCEELGRVKNTPCEAINNGVIVSLEAESRWTVTGPCYLTKLSVDASSVLQGPGGTPVCLTVDGQETDLRPGVYSGKVTLSPTK